MITIAKKHKDRMASYLRAMDLYVGQDIFLLTLARNGEMSQTELKERLNVEYPTIHKIAARLEKRGLVEKTSDLTDNRVSVIRLNTKGKEVTQKIEFYWERLDKEFFDPLSDDEQLQLQELLKKLNQ
ncbi:MAG: MarR family transcriptional regulator [Salibacteraceae bacterium]